MPLPPAEQLPIRIDFATNETIVTTGLDKELPADYHITDLDYIDISEAQFKYIFYDNQNEFFVNPLAKASITLSQFISFSSKYRAIMPSTAGADAKEFGLIDQILFYYCQDANLSEEDFTPASMIALHKQIHTYADLRDVYLAKTNDAALNSNLNWEELVYTVRSAYDKELIDTVVTNPTVILTYSVYFLPAPQATITFKPVVIKFNYRTKITLYETYPKLDKLDFDGETGATGPTGLTGPTGAAGP